MKKNIYPFTLAFSNNLEDKNRKNQHLHKYYNVPKNQVHPDILRQLYELKDKHKNELILKILESDEKRFMTTIIIFNIRMLCMAIINSFMILYLTMLLEHFTGNKD